MTPRLSPRRGTIIGYFVVKLWNQRDDIRGIDCVLETVQVHLSMFEEATNARLLDDDSMLDRSTSLALDYRSDCSFPTFPNELLN